MQDNVRQSPMTVRSGNRFQPMPNFQMPQPFPILTKKDHKEIRRSALTWGNLALNGLIIAFLFFINRFGALGNSLCLIILAVMALQGVAGALKALSMLSLVIMGNPYMVEQSIVLTFFRFPLLGLAGARILFDVYTKRPDLLRMTHLNALLFFGMVCVLIAPINGYYTQISILKTCLFVYGAYVILAGTEVNRSGVSDLTVWFTAIIAFVALVSYLSIPLGISHVHRGELKVGIAMAGLSGITSHQQTLGSFAAISAVFCFSVGVFSRLPKRWIFIVLFLSFLPLLVMTKSRTAVGTLLLSITFVVCASPWVLRGRKARFNRFEPGKWLAMGAIALVLGFIIDIATGGKVSDKVTEFALKGMASKVSSNIEFEDITASRMGLIEQSWYIFLKNPLTGINFGTSVSTYFQENATAFSAPTEKGFMPTALLEEVGIVGTSAFLIFLYFILRKLVQDENIIGLGLFVGFLIQNMGEMMFFSFGGAGMYCWTMVGAGMAVGYRHQFFGVRR